MCTVRSGGYHIPPINVLTVGPPDETPQRDNNVLIVRHFFVLQVKDKAGSWNPYLSCPSLFVYLCYFPVTKNSTYILLPVFPPFWSPHSTSFPQVVEKLVNGLEMNSMWEFIQRALNHQTSEIQENTVCIRLKSVKSERGLISDITVFDILMMNKPHPTFFFSELIKTLLLLCQKNKKKKWEGMLLLSNQIV